MRPTTGNHERGDTLQVKHHIDISVPLGPKVIVWPGRAPVAFSHSHGELDGAAFTVTRMEIDSHTGTHIDAPFHFIAGGDTSDRLPIDVFVGPAQVCDLRRMEAIGAEHLRDRGAGSAPRCLLKTDNSEWIKTGPIPEAPTYLSEEGARYLVDQGVRLVGIDGLSVDHTQRTAAHLVLLKAGVIILEAIDLSDVAAGEYDLLCLPLLVAGADGAPARAALQTQDADGRQHAAAG